MSAETSRELALKVLREMGEAEQAEDQRRESYRLKTRYNEILRDRARSNVTDEYDSSEAGRLSLVLSSILTQIGEYSADETLCGFRLGS